MKNLFEPLPKSVTVNGVDYAVVTDFRDWLRFEAMLADIALSDAEKLRLSRRWYCDDIPAASGVSVAALADFFIMRESKAASSTTGAQKRRERITDLTEDAGLIYAAFLQSYGIDLITIPYLHWWAFRALLDGLPDSTQYAKVVGIRATDIKELPKSMRERYGKMKQIVGLRVAKPAQHTTVAERDEAMKRRAREISTRP